MQGIGLIDDVVIFLLGKHTGFNCGLAWKPNGNFFYNIIKSLNLFYINEYGCKP